MDLQVREIHRREGEKGGGRRWGTENKGGVEGEVKMGAG